jgi:mannose-6-phosphate isomerase-like protein (cupin superfamily)
MADMIISAAELKRRTILRTDWVPLRAAFIDCRTPGSDQKDNYSFIGSGVSQSAQQFVNLEEPHGFNVGAAGMPNGVTNNLHLHFTAEVFINFGGEFLIRWGADGHDGEYISTDGDVISVPSWIFRGFTNIGPDNGILLTVLGHDVTGGIIWGPSVLKEAESYGLYLTADNRLIDTVAGDVLPEDVKLIKPMKQIDIDALTPFTLEQMRARVTQNGDRVWISQPFLCSTLTGGGAELALVIGYGMTEDRRAIPRLHEPHHFNLSWLRARPGEGLLTHRHDESQILVGKAGRWRVTLNRDLEQRSVELGPQDMLSVPPSSWRSIELIETGQGRGADPDTGELLVVNGGDGRVRLEWDETVMERARQDGWVIDPNGYLAPSSVMMTATDDD